MKQRLDQPLYSLLIRQLFEYWYFYLFAFIALISTHWIQSFLPFLAKELADIVDTGIEGIETWKFFALAFGIIVFRTASRLFFFYPARILQKNLRVELLSRLENVSPSRYQKYPDGQLFQVLTMDMEQIRALIGFALMQVANIIVAMAIFIPKIMEFNSRLIVALSPLVITFTIFTIIVSRNRKYYRITQDLQGEVQNVIIETYAGKKTIKNFHSEESFISLFDSLSFKELLNFYKAGIGVAFSLPMIGLGVSLSMVWGAHIIFQEGLGASSLVLFSGFIFLFLEPMMFVSWIGVVFARSTGSWDRIREVVNDTKSPSEIEGFLARSHQVWEPDSKYYFSTDFWAETLRLKIDKGSWTVLIGKTGCGKSHILAQVAEVLKAKREKVSFVSQEPYLFNDTLMANILLGQEETPELRALALRLLKLFELDYLEENEEKLLNMEVGENGKRLSGGQSKRLCLVRSLLSPADFLIWDDPFSSVDLVLEKEIIQAFKNSELMGRKTFLMSSHRLSTVRSCDQVIFLEKENGIIEEGSRTDILLPKTKTYEYFKNQMV